MVAGRSVVEMHPDAEISKAINKIWNNLMANGKEQVI
jgi:predicted nuclease with RNAse H fold